MSEEKAEYTEYLFLAMGAMLFGIIIFSILTIFFPLSPTPEVEPLFSNAPTQHTARFSCQGLLLEQCAIRYLTDYNYIYKISPMVCVEWEETDCPIDEPLEYFREKDGIHCQENSDSTSGRVINFDCTKQVYIDELITNWQDNVNTSQDWSDLNKTGIFRDANELNQPGITWLTDNGIDANRTIIFNPCFGKKLMFLGTPRVLMENENGWLATADINKWSYNGLTNVYWVAKQYYVVDQNTETELIFNTPECIEQN